jgi:hypothetical protein
MYVYSPSGTDKSVHALVAIREDGLLAQAATVVELDVRVT